MRRLRFLVSFALVAFLVCAPTAPAPTIAVSAAQTQQEKKQVTVWVNTRSGVYWCPGGRWYGRTKQGKYMGECEAIKDGYRPAYGKPCGSDCSQAGRD